MRLISLPCLQEGVWLTFGCRHPVLVAVDDFQALYGKTTYKDPQFEPIKSYHLSTPRLLIEYASGKKSFVRPLPSLFPCPNYSPPFVGLTDSRRDPWRHINNQHLLPRPARAARVPLTPAPLTRFRIHQALRGHERVCEGVGRAGSPGEVERGGGSRVV